MERHVSGDAVSTEVELQTEQPPDALPPSERKRPRALAALIPVVLTGLLIVFFVRLGPAGIFPGNFPPVEDLTVGKVTLNPNQIQIVVTNGGPSPVTIAQVLINDALWQFSSSDPGSLPRLRSTVLTIPYPWVEAEPINITLVSSTGLTFNRTIQVATQTPPVDGRFLLTFALLGIYIGFVPVVLGMTWKPFLTGLSRRWINFFLALTVGVLLFIGFDTLAAALAQAQALPTAFGGLGVVATGGISAFALILLISRRFKARKGSNTEMITAFTVAFGIGVHNFGEGLAVGAAYRLGEIALGSLLVIGFALHNTTEGLGIVSILAERKTSLGLLATLGLIAGLPTVAGAWAGAYFFTPILAAFFLAVATGAIVEVVYDVTKLVGKRSESGLMSVEFLSGVSLGLAIMYLTALLVSA